MLEGFYELCKTVEISMRHIGKVYASDFEALAALRAQRNRFRKSADRFATRSREMNDFCKMNRADSQKKCAVK